MLKRTIRTARWITKIIAGAAALLLSGLPLLAAAQGGAPIKMIMPYAPGSGPELASRLLAEEMSPLMGVPVVVENRVGAAGKIAVEALVRSDPDGRTIMFAGAPQLLIMPAIDKKPSYDIFRDVRMVAVTTKYDLVLLVGGNSGIKTAKELFARMRQQGGKISYYSTGLATQGGLAGKIFNDVLKGDALAVAYKGTSLAIPDVLAGRVTYGFDALGGRLELIKSGQLVALATSARERLSVLPNVPTLLEEGLPDFYKLNWTSWSAVIAPAKTADDVVNRMNKAIVDALKAPSAQPKLAALFFANASGLSAADSTKLWQADFATWKPALLAAGATMD